LIYEHTHQAKKIMEETGKLLVHEDITKHKNPRTRWIIWSSAVNYSKISQDHP
jgi:hypothetical protein